MTTAVGGRDVAHRCGRGFPEEVKLGLATTKVTEDSQAEQRLLYSSLFLKFDPFFAFQYVTSISVNFSLGELTCSPLGSLAQFGFLQQF